MSRIEIRSNVADFTKTVEVTAKGERHHVVAHEVLRRMIPLLGIPKLTAEAEALANGNECFVVHIKSPTGHIMFSLFAAWLDDVMDYA